MTGPGKATHRDVVRAYAKDHGWSLDNFPNGDLFHKDGRDHVIVTYTRRLQVSTAHQRHHLGPDRPIGEPLYRGAGVSTGRGKLDRILNLLNPSTTEGTT